MSKFLKAIVNIVLLVAILSAGALLIPPLLGVTTKVSDGTGNTNLSRGSVTYATSTRASQLETGDRILQDDSSGSYVYTVTSIAADTSTYTLTDEVSGDTQEQQLSGGVQKVVLTVPVIGMLSLTLQSREGIIILGLCVAFLIILFILSEVWRKDDEEETEEDEGDEEDEDEAEAEEEDSERPLTRKEKRRLKKEARRKAREEEEDEDDDDVTEADGEFPEESSEDSEEKEVTASGDEVPENGEDAETDSEDSEDEMTVRPLEEEPEESTVVETGSLSAAAGNSAEEEQSGEIPDTMTEKEDTEEDESEELERSLAEAVGALLRGETPEGEEDAAESETESEENEEIPEAEEVPETTEEEAEAETETEETGEAADGERAEEEEPSESEAQPEEAAEEPEEERDPEEPVELAMPILTAEELLKKAEEAGDHPKVIEDEETGVTILDYSDIL